MSKLDDLVANGTIQSYSVKIFDMDGIEIEKEQGSRCTQKLTLIFVNGQVCEIESFCSGISENTCLIIE